MPNRYVAFGYEITEGKYTIIEKEKEIIENIYAMYINNMSFIEISNRMNDAGISYNNDGRNWNKNIIKRILENEKYLGKDGYPQIIPETTFEKVRTVRNSKFNTPSKYDKELNDIYHSMLICSKCGQPLKKYNGPVRNGKSVDYYKCFEGDCRQDNITISKANLDIIIIKILNEMIRQYEPPEIVKGVNAQTEDELELCKEINQDIQNQDSEASDIVEKICRLATMRYNSCANECMDAINENIKGELSIRAVKNKIDTKLLKYIAKKIVLYQGKVIEMELINGDIRKRGLEYGNKKCSI